MKTGIEMIAAERERQIAQERWTPEHDDKHVLGEMATAAACYAEPMRTRPCAFHSRAGWMPLRWPWSFSWWKPTPNDRMRELVKAGALIAAEIDRIQREAAR